MRKKIIIYSLTFLALAWAVYYTAIFYNSEIKIINADLEKIREYAKFVIVNPKKEPVYLKDFSKIKDNLISVKSDFLEVNLSSMKVSFYQAGDFKNDFPILAKGDPQEWGGSASGLYQVISGNTVTYSNAAEVYMPYALHYYGKYYLHGEPYYPGGGKRYTDATGGCIQLSDNDAKTVFNLTKIGMPVLVIDKENNSYGYLTEKTSRFPQISGQSFLVADLDSGFVFAEKKSKDQWPIASLAKLMTAVVVSENVDLRNSIQITPSMLTGYGSTEGLEAGKIFRVVELFYPLLIESSNDAAQVLSYFLGQQKTIKLMNEKAKAIMMENTEFVSPGGFSFENVSTSQDLYYLTRYVLDNRPLLLGITRNEEVKSFGEISFKKLINKNLFFDNPNFIGGKTGYIEASQYNGIFIFSFPTGNGSEKRIAIIILGSPNLETTSDSLKNDTEKIIDWLKINYFGG